MNYTIYKNRVHKYAAIHKGSCTRLKVHGGVSSTTPPTGEYCEDIETLAAAQREAANTGWEVKTCSYCKP